MEARMLGMLRMRLARAMASPGESLLDAVVSQSKQFLERE